jgi:hypothetical protein
LPTQSCEVTPVLVPVVYGRQAPDFAR